MSINKSISYILCNKDIIVYLYKLHFSSFPFSLQPNKKVFHPLTFPPLQPNTQKGKLNIFHPPTSPFLHPNGPLICLYLKYITHRCPNESPMINLNHLCQNLTSNLIHYSPNIKFLQK